MGEQQSLTHYKFNDESSLDLMKDDWDYLIILDACRHDYFRKLYNTYLSGDLRMAFSPASDTREWIKKVFRNKYEDIFYVSANPHVNSKRVDVASNGFNAREHFPKIVDVWDSGWDEEFRTIPPEEVNKATIDANLANPNQRMIIHYLQPHAPYLCLPDHAVRSIRDFHDLDMIVHSLRNGILQRLWQTISSETSFFSRMALKTKKAFPKKSVIRPIDVELRKRGRNGLLKAYECNLKSVLKSVSKLVKHLSGKIVITADHGELLGEKNEWGHRPYYHVPKLLKVPYFEISA